jgi:hypothetical protein
LAGSLGQEDERGRNKGPLFIRNIGGVKFAGGHHPADLGMTSRPIHNSL